MLQVTKTVPPLSQLEGKIKTVSKIILVSIQALARRKQHAAKITIQEILSPGNTLPTDIPEALLQGQVLLFDQIAREKASACFLVRHSRDISYTYPCETCIYMHPCETLERQMHPSLEEAASSTKCSVPYPLT